MNFTQQELGTIMHSIEIHIQEIIPMRMSQDKTVEKEAKEKHHELLELKGKVESLIDLNK